MEIRIATTLEEKQKIYSLRYECYVAELGWKYDEVGVEKRELCDPEDETATILLGRCLDVRRERIDLIRTEPLQFRTGGEKSCVLLEGAGPFGRRSAS